MEADLASAVAFSLGLVDRSQPKKHVPNERAHDYLLKARFEDSQFTFAASKAAISDFRRAVELDPNYADAWAGLAGAFWSQEARVGPNGEHVDISEADRQTLDCYRKAIQLDPDNARAHAGLGLFALQRDWDWDRAERELRAAAESGSAGAVAYLGHLYLITGRRAEADEYDRRVRDMDPINPVAAYNRGVFLASQGRWEEAREEYAKLVAANPAVPTYQAIIYGLDGRMGKLDESIRNLRKMPQGDPSVTLQLAFVEALAGHGDEALRLMQSTDKRVGGLAPMNWAQLYAIMGDESNMFKYLDQAVAARLGFVTYAPVMPDFAKWRHTAEFRRLMKRMNLNW